MIRFLKIEINIIKKLIWWLSFMIFLFPYELKSQNPDSLIQSLDKEPNDTLRIKAYLKIIKFFNSSEPIKALPYDISLTTLAKKVNIEKFLAASYNQLGITYYLLGNTNQSAEMFLKVLKVNEKNNDSLGISRSFNNIGLAYHDEKAYTKSLEYFKQSLEIKLRIKDYPTLWTTYINIGLSYSALNEYNKALNNYYLGLDAWRLLKEEKNESYASIMSEIGTLYEETDSLKSAEQSLNEAVIYFEKSKSSFRVANTLLHLAIIYRKKGNNTIAQDYLNKSIKLINESGAFSILPDYFLELSKIEESKGNIKKAFVYYKKQQVLKDSLDREKNLKEMNQMQEMYKIEKQEAETVALKKEIELAGEKLVRTKLITFGIIILFILVFVFSIYLLININRWKIANNKLKNQQKIIVDDNEVLEQQKKELQILANDLKNLNADKDRFISILGHDLKSPFNNLLGLSEVLTEDIHKLNIGEIDSIANDINKSARIAFRLLEDILMWAKTKQGKMPFNPQRLSFAYICKNTSEILNPNAAAKNITIHFIEPEQINVIADFDMLKTVMRNLVSNAIKFTNNGGVINISAVKNSGDVTVSVSDNGIGIEPENLTKLFDISQVLTTKGTSGETGTGLGLLLCKEFVEKHGGKIWVESEIEKGSDFKFTLPIFT